MQRVAFVGLGKMGEPMVANLLRKGFKVSVVGHRRPEPVGRLKELGADVAATPAEAAKDCELAILMLPGSPEVDRTIAGANGLAETLPSGSIIIDCSTSNPASTRKLAKRLADKGIGFIDAGVTRGVAGATQGKLAFFIGGKTEDFERARAALEAMGDTFFYMGDVGAGHETKNISNALSYGTVALVSEMLMLGKQIGLDLNALMRALMSGAPSKALESFGPTIIAHKYEPARVSIRNVRSHLSVTREITPESAALSLIPTAHRLYDKVSELGFNDADMSAIAETWPSK